MTAKGPVLILVPRLNDSGPMKGAIALANGLAPHFEVFLVALKGVRSNHDIQSSVHVISLESKRSWWDKLKTIRRLLNDKLAQNGRVPSISLCFSADVMNRMLKGKARIISSVRANNWKNYYHTYGLLGYLLAAFHYNLLRSFDHVVALTIDMKNRLKKWGLPLHLIKNFVDEPQLERYRLNSPSRHSEIVQLLFLGILNSRKRLDLLIKCADRLKKEGQAFHLSIAGEGPLADPIKRMIDDLQVQDCVTLLGYVPEPYSLLQKTDLLILPSESEGTSRAVLEALFFGTPCILRDVDGNRELIQNGVNGFLFRRDEDLLPIIHQALADLPRSAMQNNLIPEDFRFEKNVEKFRSLLIK